MDEVQPRFCKTALVLATALLGLFESASAQLIYSVISGGVFNVTDYAGFVTPDGGHQFHFEYNGTDINEEYWKVTATIDGPIMPDGGATNVSGQPFPADKIQFRFTHDDGNPPTLANIGAPTTFIPLTTGETPLIPMSNAPIYHQSQENGNMQFTLFFAIQIGGGAYLDDFKNSEQDQLIGYTVPVTFTLYSQHGTQLGYQNVQYEIQISQDLTGTPPVSYGLEILGGDHTLELSSAAHYAGGVSNTYEDGVRINANTAYEVRVRSLNEYLVSANNDQLDVSVVTAAFSPGTNAVAGTYHSVVLSNVSQLLFTANGTSSQPQNYNVQYSIGGNDTRIFRAPSSTYSTTLFYELIPL